VLLTNDTPLLLGIQNPLTIDPLFQIPLCRLAQLIVLHRYLPYKREVVLEFLPVLLMIIVKLHPGNTRLGSRTDSKRRHAAIVEVQRANGKEVEKEAIC